MRKEDWISIDDRLPDTHQDGFGDYLYQTSGEVIATDGENWYKAIYEKGDDFEHWIIADENEQYEIEKVTHWMEIELP